MFVAKALIRVWMIDHGRRYPSFLFISLFPHTPQDK
jgi:hypothetical protein